jgi:hypothetical protein
MSALFFRLHTLMLNGNPPAHHFGPNILKKNTIAAKKNSVGNICSKRSLDHTHLSCVSTIIFVSHVREIHKSLRELLKGFSVL